MPQLDFVSYLPQIFWVLIRFFIFYAIVAKGILPTFLRILWTRELKNERALAKMGITKEVFDALVFNRESICKVRPFLDSANNILKTSEKINDTRIKSRWQLF